MLIVSTGDNLREMSKAVCFLIKNKTIPKCHLLEFLPRVLSGKEHMHLKNKGSAHYENTPIQIY